jgi:signal peptidase I
MMSYFCIIILSILYPGFGHIFIKMVKRSIFFIVSALFIQIIFWQFLCFNYFLFIISYIIFGLVQIFAIIDSIKIYRKNKETHKIIIGIVFIIFSFLFIYFIYLDNFAKLYRYRPLIVPSSTMANTFLTKDKIICDLSKKYKNNLERNDIVVYNNDRNQIIFFRCIAIENDRISILNDNVYLNGYLLDEEYKYLDKNIYNENINYDLSEIIIEKDKVFLLGDNRYNSRDSRYIGQIPKENIIGKVLFQYFSEEK